MKPIERKEIVDFETYEDTREVFRAEVMAAKQVRRVQVDPVFTFLFENRLTKRYQIQEMIRAERLVKEQEIQHEIDTYNGLLGGPGELACTLLIEIDDPAERSIKLKAWLELPEHIYLMLEDGSRVRALFDAGQRGRDRLSSVQYLKFPVKGQVPVAVGIDLPQLQSETKLSQEQRQALAEDLADD